MALAEISHLSFLAKYAPYQQASRKGSGIHDVSKKNARYVAVPN